jgi:hypothetical protein
MNIYLRGVNTSENDYYFVLSIFNKMSGIVDVFYEEMLMMSLLGLSVLSLSVIMMGFSILYYTINGHLNI